jgi:type II secretory pathway pseudopilin PulG
MRYTFNRQRGATLIVSLIMLLLITMLAVTSFRLGSSDLQIAGNLQSRKQALAAAQGAIEQVISSTQFTATPTNAIPKPCGGNPNTTCTDINGDGVTDVTVVVNPTCVSIQPIPVASLDFSNPNDAGCLVGASQDFGVAGGANNNSMCANSVWDTQATATDVVTGAQYVIDEGTAVRVPVASVCP